MGRNAVVTSVGRKEVDTYAIVEMQRLSLDAQTHLPWNAFCYVLLEQDGDCLFQVPQDNLSHSLCLFSLLPSQTNSLTDMHSDKNLLTTVGAAEV